MVIGGTHGHEPGGVATAMNLIHLIESGRDLADQPHDHLLDLLQKVHLFIVPCLNPDGRTVCPDTFYAQGVNTCQVYLSAITIFLELGAEEHYRKANRKVFG